MKRNFINYFFVSLLFLFLSLLAITLFNYQNKNIENKELFNISKKNRTTEDEKWNIDFVWNYDGSNAIAYFTNLETSEEIEVSASISSVIKENPTCENMGITTYTAKAIFENVEYTDTLDIEDIDSIDHDYEFKEFEWNYSNMTCQAVYVCKNDSSHIVKYDADINYEILVEPTCDSKGKAKYTASYEGHEESLTLENISPKGHTWDLNNISWEWNEDYTKAIATISCKNDSNHKTTEESFKVSSYKIDSNCIDEGQIIYTATIFFDGININNEKIVKVEPKGHNWNNPIWTWDGYSSATAYFECKTDSNHKESVEAIISNPQIIDADCNNDGKKIYTATVILDGKEYKDTKEEIIHSNGHNYIFDSFIFANDHKTAKAKFICSVDNEEILYDANVTSTIKVPSDCGKKGITSYTATYDIYNETIDVEDIDELNHIYQFVGFEYSSDLKSAKAILKCINNSKHVKYEDAIVTKEITRKPTCDKKGQTTYFAKYNYLGRDYVDSRSLENIDPLGHEYVFDSFVYSNDFKTAKAKFVCIHDKNHYLLYDANITKELKSNPTCLKKGINTYTATYDKYIETKDVSDIPTLKHKLIKVEAKEATNYSEGNITYYKCTIGNELYSDPEGNNLIKDPNKVIIPRKGNFFTDYGILFPLISFLIAIPLIFIFTNKKED